MFQKGCRDNISCARDFLGNMKREPGGRRGSDFCTGDREGGGPGRRNLRQLCSAVQGRRGDPWAKPAGCDKSQISQEQTSTSARCRPWRGAGWGSAGSVTGAGFQFGMPQLGPPVHYIPRSRRSGRHTSRLPHHARSRPQVYHPSLASEHLQRSTIRLSGPPSCTPSV